jgi:hypothetical protein
MINEHDIKHMCTAEELALKEKAWADLGKTPPWKDSPKPDVVNHPPHYLQHPSGVECIQITEHMGFTLGNAMKYLWRADYKNGVEDLQKAAWYINREILKRTKEKNAT